MSVSANTPNFGFNLIDFDSVTWHDDEYDNWRELDALLAAYIAAPNFVGMWANSITYTVGQQVADAVDGQVYECLVEHTSVASPTLFSADRTANPTFWEVWLISHAGDTNNPHGVTVVQISAQPLDATLTAFAALSGVADRLPYFDGADSFALATFTAAGRALMDDANAAAQRTTLELASTSLVTFEQVNVNNLRLDGNTLSSTDANGNILLSPNGAGEVRTDAEVMIGDLALSPDGTLHVHTGTAGAVTAHVSADDLVIENSTTGGLSILTPNASQGAIFFGSPSDASGGRILWNPTTKLMTIGPDVAADGVLALTSGAGSEAMRINSDGGVSIGLAADGDGLLHVYSGSAGAVTAVSTADELIAENSDNAGISILTPADKLGTLAFGTVGGTLAGFIQYAHSNDLLDLGAGGSTKVRILGTGTIFFGDVANANMTVGLTINQGTNDDQIFTLKSDDVDHGLTTGPAAFPGGGNVEIDDFFTIEKFSSTQGGVNLRALAEDASTPTTFGISAYGGTADTTKTSAGVGLVNIYVAEHDDANGITGIPANGNIFCVRSKVASVNRTAFMVDTEGNLFADAGAGTTNMVTLFDREDDIALCRAFDLLRAERGGVESQLVRTEWDDWASEHKDKLVELGVLGADGEDGARGLVNVTQLQRLHNGSICQLHSRNLELATMINSLTKRLTVAEHSLAALPS